MKTELHLCYVCGGSGLCVLFGWWFSSESPQGSQLVDSDGLPVEFPLWSSQSFPMSSVRVPKLRVVFGCEDPFAFKGRDLQRHLY